MKKAVLLWVAAVAMVGLSVSASLAAMGPYLTLSAGGTWLKDADLDYDDFSSSDLSAEVEFDGGYNFGIAAGYDFGLVRLEVEGAYRQNDVDKFKKGQFFGVGFEAGGDGDVSATSLMANIFYDLPTGTAIVPYLGGGAGVANVSFNDVEDDLGIFPIDDDDNVFAWQLAAGLALEVNPALTVDLGYRYLATEDPELRDAFGDTFETEYESHNVSLGLRFTY